MKKKEIVMSHYFNNMSYAMWPFWISLWAFVFVGSFIFYLHNNYFVNEFLLLALFGILLYHIDGWLHDLIIESSILGSYNSKVSSSMLIGFMLFLLSETMLFFGFFWSFFNFIFFNSMNTIISNYNGFEMLNWYHFPLWASFFLITSGYTLNNAFYLYKMNSYMECEFYMHITLLLASFFVCMQLTEYQTLSFSISDGVYCSLFFLLTGFHGMHVIIGILFMLSLLDRMIKRNIVSILKFNIVLLYWHFVDIMWIFLFIFVYLLNNWDYLYLCQYNMNMLHGF